MTAINPRILCFIFHKTPNGLYAMDFITLLCPEYLRTLICIGLKIFNIRLYKLVLDISAKGGIEIFLTRNIILPAPHKSRSPEQTNPSEIRTNP